LRNRTFFSLCTRPISIFFSIAPVLAIHSLLTPFLQSALLYSNCLPKDVESSLVPLVQGFGGFSLFSFPRRAVLVTSGILFIFLRFRPLLSGDTLNPLLSNGRRFFIFAPDEFYLGIVFSPPSFSAFVFIFLCAESHFFLLCETRYRPPGPPSFIRSIRPLFPLKSTFVRFCALSVLLSANGSSCFVVP